ncbi:helix-turn-helix domain-containing protein [Rhodoblastus sp.]|uniref:helix-turn-helix domain-containing protein n=1 Tax=Rhodoblastus sp. TaxID=1962975 RepID=UPI00262B06E8|nr:helix-turn-helix domain-containing protein [Rhodoblastus sp.]
MTAPRLLTPAEAAEALRISVKTLRVHVEQGELPRIILGAGRIKKHWAIDPNDLAAFIVRRKETGGAAPCRSTSRRKAPISTTTSGSKVIAFSELQARQTGAKPNG